MLITLHGTGAGLQSPERSSSCATIQLDSGRSICLDAGEGATRRMIADGIDPNSVDLVLISHSHADHWSGLPGLVAQWGLTGRSGSITIGAPANGVRFFREVLASSYIGSKAVDYTILWRQHPGELWLEDICVRTAVNTHIASYREWASRHQAPYPSYSFLVEQQGTRVLFTQDVGTEDDVIPLMARCSLVVCEAAHVDPRRVIDAASTNGVPEVVFTHIPDTREAEIRAVAAQGAGTHVRIAEDGCQLALQA